MSFWRWNACPPTNRVNKVFLIENRLEKRLTWQEERLWLTKSLFSYLILGTRKLWKSSHTHKHTHTNIVCLVYFAIIAIYFPGKAKSNFCHFCFLFNEPPSIHPLTPSYRSNNVPYPDWTAHFWRWTQRKASKWSGMKFDFRNVDVFRRMQHAWIELLVVWSNCDIPTLYDCTSIGWIGRHRVWSSLPNTWPVGRWRYFSRKPRRMSSKWGFA